MSHFVSYVGHAKAAGKLTAEQHDVLMQAAAFDWQSIIKMIPILVSLFPPLAPFAAIISAVLPFILSILNGNVTPVPTPPWPVPNPLPDGGTVPTPIP